MKSSRPKIAVILHLYYQDLWNELADAIQNLSEQDFSLYITVTEGSAHEDQTQWMADEIHSRFPKSGVFLLSNKGTDNGPFICCLDYIFKRNLHYDYVLKLHTKKSLLGSSEMWLAKVWRQELIQPIVGSKQAVDECLSWLAKPEIGMLGSKKHVTTHINTNKQLIEEYMKLLGMRKTGVFIGGNMFWIKFSVLEKYFKNANLQDIYDKLEVGYVTDKKAGTRTHSLERIWGYAVTNAGLRIHGVQPKV